MSGRFRNISFLFAVLAFVFTLNLASNAEARRAQITQKVDDSRLTTLVGNTRPETRSAVYDRGSVGADLPMDHLLLLLQRSPESEKALEQFIEAQHNPKSPLFHHWIGAQELGQRYGVAQSDIEQVTGWLESYGLKVEYVYQNHMFIDFSGTASQVENAFHTDIHYYLVNGETYTANTSDPKIPSALAGVVVGPASLNNFRPKAMNHRIQQAHIDPRTGNERPDYTAGGGFPLVPYDLQKIYNIAPLYPAGISGQGMKIVVVEDTNLWNCNSTNTVGPCNPVTSDWAVFRNTFGLGRYPMGNLAEENPGTTISNTCASPRTGGGYPAGSGINADDVEAAIDIMWATAAAPSASIINAACASPRGGFGGLLAIQNILNHPNSDNVDVISMSYGESEESSGAALNASFNTTFQQAVTAGIGIFVSSGDEDAASSDGGGNNCSGGAGGSCARDGITISGWMSSQYDVSVGGLDFADTYLGLNNTYWNPSNNVFYGSAKSYIMEQPWNDSCAGTLLAQFETGSPITYGSTGFCNTGSSSFHLAVGGSGGPSACATGAPAVGGVAGGTCAGYPKPSFQSSHLGSMAGLLNDNVRDTPDVSLMAANGLWGHYYLICYSDTTPSGINNGGTPCTGQPINWPGYGGTSVSSPIMAGIQALVVQHKGSLQGNPNPRYYALAATEYGASGNASCNSTLGNGVGNSCVFYDVTLGDIDANCQAHSGGTKYNCYLPSGLVGVLSTNNNAYQPAYPTTTGWDFGSGIGSVNAFNLVMAY
ncbi:MAG: protease pro-enzyme activation domain-containing protein [Candidatus Korobacteraceae bacterium]